MQFGEEGFQCFMTMFKSCPSLYWECTPLLVSSPATLSSARLGQGQSMFARVIELCLQTQLSLALALSCPARGCIAGLWLRQSLTPAANEEPGCQLWTNERPWNYHLSSSSHRTSLGSRVSRFGWRVQLSQWESGPGPDGESLGPDNPDTDRTRPLACGGCPAAGCQYCEIHTMCKIPGAEGTSKMILWVGHSLLCAGLQTLTNSWKVYSLHQGQGSSILPTSLILLQLANLAILMYFVTKNAPIFLKSLLGDVKFLQETLLLVLLRNIFLFRREIFIRKVLNFVAGNQAVRH